MTNPSGTPPSITPGLLYHDAPDAIEWLCRVFGFKKRSVVPGENGTILHAHLTLGNGGVMLSSAENYAFPDTHYQRTVAAKAEILIPIEDKPYGGRGYACKDPEGYVWAFGSYDVWAGK